MPLLPPTWWCSELLPKCTFFGIFAYGFDWANKIQSPFHDEGFC